MNKRLYLPIILIILSFLLGAVVWNMLPDQIATHWGASGEADGYGGKFMGLFLFPLIGVLMFLMIIFLPKLDPLKKNIEKFIDTFYNFMTSMIAFFVYIQLASIIYNFGFKFNFTFVIMPAMALLMYFSGELMSKAKRNYFIGLRTPWTLSSDKVWDKSNKFAGKLFKIIAGLVFIMLFFSERFMIIGFVTLILIAVIISIVYSYVMFKKEQKL